MASGTHSIANAQGTAASDQFASVAWSRWSRCESSFSLLFVPAVPGVFAVAEEITATSDAAEFGCRRMLAVLQVGKTDDLARGLSRLFAPGSSLRDRLAHSRCYIRYAVVPDAEQRDAVAAALSRWLAAGTAEPAPLPAPLRVSAPPAPPTARKPEFPSGF